MLDNDSLRTLLLCKERYEATLVKDLKVLNQKIFEFENKEAEMMQHIQFLQSQLASSQRSSSSPSLTSSPSPSSSSPSNTSLNLSLTNPRL